MRLGVELGVSVRSGVLEKLGGAPGEKVGVLLAVAERMDEAEEEEEGVGVLVGVFVGVLVGVLEGDAGGR